jgi:plastocyanin
MKNLITIALAAAIFLSFASTGQAREYVVKMITDTGKGAYRFEPSKLTVKSGDMVTWVNNQDDTHNVMTESAPDKARDFESPLLEKKGQKWSHVFTVSGTYAYHCHPHAENNMRGVIIVDHPSVSDGSEETGHHHGHSGRENNEP